MFQKTGQTYLPPRRPIHRNPKSATAARQSRRAAEFESLEPRQLYAVQVPVTLSAEPAVNVTKLLENQHTSVIAVNRTDPGNVFIATVSDRRVTGPLDDVDLNNDLIPDQLAFLEDVDDDVENDADYGILGAVSGDGGRNFALEGIAPTAIAPSVAFDRFGNLFATYATVTSIPLEDDPDDPFDGGFLTQQVIVLALSVDGGQTFQNIQTYEFVDFTTDTDDDGNPVLTTDSPQPTVVTGADSVWVSYENEAFTFNGTDFDTSGIQVAGARVLGLGAVDSFTQPQGVPRSTGAQFSDIAIGPNGEVMVTYEILRNDPDQGVDLDAEFGAITVVDGNFLSGDEEGPAEIFVNVDPDGLGEQTFGRRFKATDTNVGLFDPIPAQNERKIDAAPGIVWDRSGGPFNGRVWLVYTDEARNNSDDDTEIYLRFSDDNGQTWSSRRQVNDEDVTTASQFLPNIAIDQTTGNIGITWYDTRNQSGISFGPNDETQFFGTVGVPTVSEAGIAFADNMLLSSGFSDSPRARNALEYGEYTDLDFDNNVLYAVWSDNSNSTGDNPSGGVNAGTNLSTFDTYTTRVTVLPDSPRPPELAPVGPGSPLKPEFVGRDTVVKGKNFKFQVRYTSVNGIDQSTLGDDDLLITGPNGYNLFADFTKAKQAKRGTIVTATYLAAPGGKFDLGDNGLYSILVQGASVTELGAAVSTTAGLLDQFLVSSAVTPQSPAVFAATPISASLHSADAGNADDDILKAVGL